MPIVYFLFGFFAAILLIGVILGILFLLALSDLQKAFATDEPWHFGHHDDEYGLAFVSKNDGT